MGMDVYGKKPSNKRGEYFRNSVWGWHPLWSYCKKVAPEVTDKVKYGHSNDGDGLGKRDSLKLAKILREEISSGRTAAYEKEYTAAMKEAPDQKCDLCKGKGRRTDAFAKRSLPETTKPKGCNACGGKGKVRPFATHYPFELDNVAEFAEFLENCGGFEIC